MDDPFEGMDLFARVVEAGNFTKAAAAMGVAKSSVSERIAALERRLGVRLLERSTRRLRITEAGQIFYARSREARETANAAHAELEALSAAPAGLLRVGTFELFTRLHLIPALGAFLSKNPLMRIEFVETSAVQDLVAEGLDVAIRLTSDPAPNTIARKIGTSNIHVVATPDYLARHGAPAHPSEIVRHRTVGFAPLHWGHEWRFNAPEGTLNIPVTPVLLTSSTETLRGGAQAGLGLTAIPDWAVSDLVADGSLSRVLEDFDIAPRGIYAIYPSNRFIAPKVRQYVDHVIERLRFIGA